MKRFISWIICLSLILGGMPQVLPVADTYGEETAETETGKTVDLSKYKNLTIVSSDIEDEDGTGIVRWTKDKTYVICSVNTVVAPSVKCKLIIEPGTTVLFGTGTGGLDGVEKSDVKYRPYPIFWVDEHGSIEAKGTEDEPITFKNIGTHAGWNGIDITLPDSGEVTDTFEYCNFINGSAQFRDFTEGFIDVSYGTEKTKFNLTIDNCKFDSTELVNRDILQPSEIGAGLYYGDHDGNKVEANIKVSNSTFKSLSMGIEACVSAYYDEYLYNENLKCTIENNVFENNITGSYNPSVIWGGNAKVINNTFYTMEGGALTKSALDLEGQCDYVLEGNVFHGSQSTDKGKVNECTPICIRFGANVNPETRSYKENKCDYPTSYGKLIKLKGSMIKEESILGNVEGLEYWYYACTTGYKNGVKSKVIFEPGTSHLISSLETSYNGELVAKGTKEEPIKFVSGSSRGIDTGADKISLQQNSSSEYLEGKATFENCQFDGVGLDANIISKSTDEGLNGEIPLVFSVKDCIFKNMSTGLDIGFDCYYDYIYGRVSIENVDIEGIENDSFTGMFVSSYGSKIPKGNIFKASNCKIHNFNYKDYEGVALQAEVSEETADKVVFENITMADNNYGIIAKKNRLTKLPIIKNCIIAGNKKGFDFNNEIDTSSITYSCIYNDSWNGNTYGYGEGCIFTDPLFADSKNGDFHLMSKAGRWYNSQWVVDDVSSPCIDAGDENSDYSNEPAPNGGRVNMGYYGNTAEASKTEDGSTSIETSQQTTTPQQTTGLQTTPTNVTTPQQTKITIKQTTTSQVTTKKIKLKAPVIKKITKVSKKINIKFKKITVSGGYYQIQYSTNGKFKKAKTVNVKASKTKVTIKRLKSKKKYFVRARIYRKVKINGKTKKIYSAWSKTKKIRIK